MLGCDLRSKEKRRCARDNTHWPARITARTGGKIIRDRRDALDESVFRNCAFEERPGHLLSRVLWENSLKSKIRKPSLGDKSRTDTNYDLTSFRITFCR